MILLIFCFIILCTATDDDDDDFEYSKGPVPNHFYRGQRYPDRDENIECRPIKLRVARGSRRYKELVTYSGNYIHFIDSNSRIMTSRMHSRLNNLAIRYYQLYAVKILVLKTWVEYPDYSISNTSLHYEGRSVRIHITSQNATTLLKLAVEYALFDWVQWHVDGYAHLSVIPDACETNVDIVFIADQSGSVGFYNHLKSLQFMIDVIDFFNVAPNATQVGLITYSTFAHVRFDLDDISSKQEMQNLISHISYPGGYTATALGLFQAGVILNPNEYRGARPLSDGVPRIAVLITDGQSNLIPIDEVAISLQNFGVQVFTVGIGNIYLPELKFIATDPDPLHVFLLDSFNDAQGFVDFLSFTTCDAPAIVEPGENTTTEVPEDGFRFFQTECNAFSISVVIEQIDLYGKCSLYASNVIPNPGPLDDHALVVRNEDKTKDKRSVILKLSKTIKKIIYISIRGVELKNLFSVIIWDVIFNEEYYVVNAFEGVIDVTIFNLNDQLSIVGQSFSYRIKKGNEGGEFEINNITGELFVRKPLNIYVQSYYILEIVAENINASCHRGRVKIKVIVVRNEIEFEDPPAVSIAEDETEGFVVTQVQADGGNSVIEYSIISGNTGSVFQINESTGIITISDDSTLDFETTPQYQLTIQAVSTPGGLTATAVQIINITDVNETPFFITICAINDDCTFEVLEEQTPGLVVDDIEADDPDFSSLPNGMLTYDITPNSVPFNIDNTGTITTNATLDREAKSMYMFTVVVSDGGSPSLSVATNVTVQVGDINDNPPQFIRMFPELSIPEDFSIGIVTEYEATDDDIGINAQIIYSLSSDDPNLPFAINSISGALLLTETLDFDLGRRTYNFCVIASNPDGLNSSVSTFVQVLDVNDNAPQFTEDQYQASVAEHSPNNTFVVLIEANDIDSGNNSIVQYSITSGNTFDSFKIDSQSGEITVNNDIDREIISIFTLTVQAEDMGSPNTQSNTVQAIITILDINDNAPIFQPNNLQVTLPEDEPLGPIENIIVMAIDLDDPDTPNAALQYFIVSGNEDNTFMINITSGQLELLQALDFETTPFYSLVIKAEDQGDPIMSGFLTLNITILNVNDNEPIISGNQSIAVLESEPIGFRIAQFTATDLDQMRIEFNLTSGGEDIFSINVTTGVISLSRMLDFESLQQHILVIEARDGIFTAKATLTVNVIDVNEFIPQFENDNQFSVLEEQPVGTIVGTVQASDQDTSQVISYSIQLSPLSSQFVINSTTGIITTAFVLDREFFAQEGIFIPPDSQESITIIATDDGVIPGSFENTQDVFITLLDINDNDPIFDAPLFQGFIDENGPNSAPVLTVSATDADLFNNSEIRYSLVDGDSLPFAIDPVSGQVNTTVSLDREEIGFYQLNITATDLGTEPRSSFVLANVFVDDENDNAPVFDGQLRFTISEDTRTDIAIFQVSASDDDIGTNADLIYRIIGAENCPSSAVPTPSECIFAVDEEMATFLLTQSLDFETQTLHNLTLEAIDQGMPPQSSSTNVIIDVQNVDEIPPQFLGPCDAEISEEAPINSNVTQCLAEDFDEVANETVNNVEYEIVLNIDNTFSIDQNGVITTNVELDREQRDEYILIVRVTDAGGLFTQMEVNITVTDVDDNIPQFVAGPFSISIQDDQIANYETELISVLATDADIGSNGEVAYEILSEEVDPLNRLSVLVIEARDNGNPCLSTNTTLSISFESSCHIQEYSIDSLSGVVTGLFLCSVDILPSISQISIGGEVTLMCTVLRNIDAMVIFLHNDTLTETTANLGLGDRLTLYIQDNLTFNDAGTYDCRANSDIGSLQTSTSSIVEILVPVMITQSPGEVFVEVQQFIQLECQADGLPAPSWTWLQQSNVVAGNGRVFPSDQFLTIPEAQLEDDGEYTCRAVNPISAAEATGRLTVFEVSQVIQVDIKDVSDPDPDNGCNSFNTQNFQNTMNGITGHNTHSTNTTGDRICNSDACHPNPCENGGLCTLTSDGYECECIAGFIGPECSEDINECEDLACLNGGICTNIPGGFTCECPDRLFGDVCEYNHNTCECPPTFDCFEAEGEASECVAVATSGLLIVQDPVPQNTIILDQVVNTLNEDPPSNSRRKRDGFVTACSAKFLRAQGSENTFTLVWVCPEGVSPPNNEQLNDICFQLVQKRVVNSCTIPGGFTLQIPHVNSSTAYVHFIIVDVSTRRPLSSEEAIALLEDTDALNKLKENGFNAGEFKAVAPPQTKPVSSSRHIGGAVGGVLIGMALVGVAIVILLIVIKIRYNKKKRLDTNITDSIVMSKVINSTEEVEEDMYSLAGGLMLPLGGNDNTYVVPDKEPRSPHSPIFDDPVYTTRYRTLSKKRRTVSTENLLEDTPIDDSGDYDEPHSPRPVQTNDSTLEDEPIYGNMGYEWKGYNIGERWENYQKTKTILRNGQ